MPDGFATLSEAEGEGEGEGEGDAAGLGEGEFLVGSFAGEALGRGEGEGERGRGEGVLVGEVLEEGVGVEVSLGEGDGCAGCSLAGEESGDGGAFATPVEGPATSDFALLLPS